MERRIIYIDDNDRSYGLSGMAISMALLDNEEKIMEIDIDRYPDPIDFTHDFYFSGNPRCSAKMVWNEMTRHFHLSMAMAIGNLLSRRLVAQSASVTGDEETRLRDTAVEEGAEACGLEEDEVAVMWNKDYEYLSNVFAHPRVRSIARNLASELLNRRVLTRHELLELLADFNR